MDGFIQSLPYHMYAYMIPMHKYMYLGMFAFVNCWTVMIHDGKKISKETQDNTLFANHISFFSR